MGNETKAQGNNKKGRDQSRMLQIRGEVKRGEGDKSEKREKKHNEGTGEGRMGSRTRKGKEQKKKPLHNESNLCDRTPTKTPDTPRNTSTT